MTATQYLLQINVPADTAHATPAPNNTLGRHHIEFEFTSNEAFDVLFAKFQALGLDIHQFAEV